jgi:hypothetical protein
MIIRPILIILFIGALIGSQYYKEERTIDWVNNQTDNLNWKDKTTGNETIGISKSMNRLVDFIGVSAIEIVKYGIVKGYANPEYNYNFLIKLVMISMVTMLIIPTFYLILGIYCLVLFTIEIIADWRKKKNESNT